MTDVYDAWSAQYPQRSLRIAPAARAQLDAPELRPLLDDAQARSGPDIINSLIGDATLRLLRRWHDAELQAWAAGLEFGPIEFETVEAGPTSWKIRATSTLRPRRREADDV